MRQHVRYISTIVACYILTIGTLGLLLQRTFAVTQTPIVHAQANAQIPVKPVAVQPITGIPLRIVIPSYGIDLPVIDGEYNNADGSWTLSDTEAHYATMSNPANDTNGNTLIYGHGTDRVFGKLGANHPPPGTIAELHTDKGMIFTYTFRDATDLVPEDTSIFDTVASGTPRLTIQTCTGAWSQWRTMFTFDFKSVRHE